MWWCRGGQIDVGDVDCVGTTVKVGGAGDNRHCFSAIEQAVGDAGNVETGRRIAVENGDSHWD